MGCGFAQGDAPKEKSEVVFRTADGRSLTVDDLRGLDSEFHYEILGKSNVPAQAEVLHQKAQQAGEAGDYKKAIGLLEQASKLAPEWPYPVYDMAFSYLLLKDTENARKFYRKTVEMSPRGYFTAITALDTLVREEKGELPPGTYLAYVSLEWLDPGKKTELVRRLTASLPSFAPGWLALAGITENDTEKLAAIEKGLAAKPDAETKGMLQINKGLLLDRRGERDSAVRLLGGLALDPASTHATEHLAKVALRSVVEQ
jgi:tetratricopeptide (TPR) repeat protein